MMSEYAMIEVYAALAEVVAAAAPLKPVMFPLSECCGLRAAESVYSPGIL